MSPRRKVSCVLCSLSDETETTGALSTKDQVTAHQNCLLFSSGIFCRDSPEFHDLFGFSVEDVMDEVKRGSKLTCSKCKKKGATAGCEVGRCKKSYHYPCAVKEGAETIEDHDNGNYGLYCYKHTQRQRNKSSVNGLSSSSTKAGSSKTPSEAGSSKAYCLACEETEGNIRLKSFLCKLHCDKRAPSSYQRSVNGDSAAAGPSACSSDSNSSSSAMHPSSKRRLSFNDKQEMAPSKRKSESWTRRISESSNSDENEPNTEMEIFAPLESDLDDSIPEHQCVRGATERNASEKQLEDESGGGNEDETLIHSDAESESLLLPVEVCATAQSLSTAASAPSPQTASAACPRFKLVMVTEAGKIKDERSSPEQNPVQGPHQRAPGPSVPAQSSTGPPPSPGRSRPRSVTGSPRFNGLAPAPPGTICVPLPVSSPMTPPRDPEPPSIDSPSFWRSCNAAGCTQAIFTDFIHEMNDISSRIQSDQASQDDYDLALTVMRASGKLTQLVAKQQKELQRKRTELTKAAAAMKEVVSALGT